MTAMTHANISDAQSRPNLPERPRFPDTGTAHAYDLKSVLIAPARAPDWLADADTYLESLRQLVTNWDGEDSPPPSPEIIQSAQQFLANYIARLGANGPKVEPTRVGGIMISWESGQHDLEVDFVTADVVEYVYFDNRTRQLESGILCSDDRPPSDDKLRFERFIRRYFARHD